MKYFNLALFCALTLLHTALCQEYTIITPKAFRIGAEETVVLNLHGYTGATVSSFSFILPRNPDEQQINHLRIPIVLNANQVNEPIRIPVTIPPMLFNNIEIRSTQFVEFTVEVTGSNADFTKSVEVLLSKESGYLFIVTDRPVYRPSETVAFHLFPLKQKMDPEREVFFQVIIRTPDGIGVYRTNPRLLNRQNLPYTDSYPLPDYPEVGIWIIEAIYKQEGFETSQQTTFKVDRYVLPTFQVNVELNQRFFLLSDDGLDFAVTADYSYGEKVDGSVFVSVKLKKSADSPPSIEVYKRPVSILAETAFVNGRRSFSVPIRNILLQLGPGESLESIAENGGALVVEAAVNGLAEGVVEMTRSPEIPFIRSPFKIDLSRLSNFYTPTLIYEMQFDIVNAVSNAPLGGINVDITCNGVTESTLSDDRGQVNFQCQFVGTGNQNVQIVTTEEGLNADDQASEDLVIEPYTSPTDSYIQVEVDAVLSIGQPNVFINFRINKDTTEIRYQILARGTIVASGVTDVGVGDRESNQRIEITADMVPSARIVAYYLNGAEIVSNSKWFDVVNECKEEVSVNVVEDEILPGGALNFQLQGAPGEVVTVLGVDRAAYFLYNKGRLTRDLMFKQMESYDQGCVRTGGRNAENVFERAGVLVTTSSSNAPVVDTLSCGAEEASRKKRQAEQAVQNADINRLERDLARCKRDGGRPLLTKETCDQRAARVREYFRLIGELPECWGIFLEACQNFTFLQQQNQGGFAGRSAGTEDAEIQALVDANPRSSFQESLIFTFRTLDAGGRASFFERAQDSITTYDIDAIGMSDQDDGFCISEPDEVRVFKPVFVQIFTPYSLREGEQADMRISVFNYGDQQIENVRIQVKHDPIFCSSFVGEEFSTLADLGVPPNGAASANFAIFPLEAGVGEIQVRAVELDRKVILDTVVKQIIIEAPGELKDIDGTEAIDLSLTGQAGQEFEFNFDIQDIFTPDTRQCWIFAYANLLGPSIEIDPVTQQPNNVADIFKMPYGCGEQNMLRTAPNIYTHGYMVAAGILVEGTPQYDQSITLMDLGFARELDYRSNLVNLEAWAVFAHFKPSTWLNAFVDKVFTKARTYNPNIATDPICSSLNWLLTQQHADGYFIELQAPLHKEMHGAVGGRFTLTSYVVIALLESTSGCSDAINNGISIAVNNAINFLENNKDQPVFTNRPFGISLLAYALSLYDPNSPFALEIFDRMWALHMEADDGKKSFWQARPLNEIQGTGIHAYWYQRRPQAVDIETTAYALLTFIEQIKASGAVTQFDLDNTKSIAVWLICQYNSNGAFISTQDTVMGLQALAAYQTWFASVMPNQPKANIDILLIGRGNSSWALNPESFNIDENNQNFRTRHTVPLDVIENGGVTVVASGEGQGQVAYRCIYRTTVDEESCHFDLETDVQVLNEQAFNAGTESLKVLLTIVVSKPVGRQADSSIIDVGLMSGFVATEPSLQRIQLENSVDGVVDRFEISNQNIIFYVSKIALEPVIIAFELVRQTRVNRPQPAKINVYDYYEPSVQCGKFYSLPGNLEKVRTTGCDNDDEMCKCAEGGCPVCRPRDDQLESTTCLRGNRCNTCVDKDDCENLFQRSCQNNFAYIVNITTSPQANGGVFTSFTGVITEVLKEGDEPKASVKDQERKFELRSDCYAACQDNRLAPIPNDGNFIRDNFPILIIGNNPEKVTRNGVETRNYIMKKGAVMERIIPQRQCDAAIAAIRRIKCNNNSVIKTDAELEECDRRRKVNTACRNMRDLMTQLEDFSCD